MALIVFTTRPELSGRFGMVASTHWLASMAGFGALEEGGNAFDAVVIAGLALQVLEPHRNGPGGELPVVYHCVECDNLQVLNAQGTAPAKATVSHFRSLGLEVIPGMGLLAACVPGAFDGWMKLLAEHGTLSVRRALTPAIDLAEGGYPVHTDLAAQIAAAESTFLSEWPTSAEIYLVDGVPRPGSLFRNPQLAETYSRIVNEAEATSSDRDAQIQSARNAFYRGFVAQAIHDYVDRVEVIDESGERRPGCITGDDLATFEAKTEDAVTFDYHGYTVCKPGPWSQGPVFLQQLALLEGFDLLPMGHNSEMYIHTVVESAKLAFADREAWYGDPEFVEVPIDALLEPDYSAARRDLIGDSASLDLKPGSVGEVEPRLPKPFGVGLSPDTTCHVDAVDRWGNLVSATPSGGLLQFSPVIPGLGFGLSERAQAFSLEEGLPNSLEGGKRPRTTLSPSLALRDGEPYLAFGTPGGDRQDQWSLQFFLAHAEFGMNLQEAIDAPLFHSTHFPRSFFPRDAYPGQLHVEARLPESVREGLHRRGHELKVTEEWSPCWITAVARDGEFLKSAASPRGMQAYAVGR